MALAFFFVLGELTPPANGPAAPDDEQAQLERLRTAAMARIAAESRGEAPKPQVQAPPKPSRPVDPPPQPDRSPPQPPEGYTFVTHSGEMPKARIEEPRPPKAGEEQIAGWLNPQEGVPALLRQAGEAGRNWTFGWLDPGPETAPADLVRALEATGAEVIGQAGRLVRARLPGNADSLWTIADLDEVAGLGATPAETKLAAFVDPAVDISVDALPIYVTLMAHDADGRWRQAMEALGAVVGGYDAELRVYRANAGRATIDALAEADYVLSVEPIPMVKASHDTAVPAMGADALRAYDGAPGLFTGIDGASVPIGVMDTGLNVAHWDIAAHRDSICGANFVPDASLFEEEDLWNDADGHGTHVTGTVAGNGFVEQRYAGMAPGVRHIRFAKVLSLEGWGWGSYSDNGMDFLAEASGCETAGARSERAKALIVNMSLSATWILYEGRDTGARKLDTTVWGHRQLYVVAQSNAGASGFSNYGAAKNSLAVGAALDGGTIASFSSLGPTADGRLAPNVVGTGVQLHSARGGGVPGGYQSLGGTSMSSPAVAGVAALLMDASPEHKEQPALTRARLMASAVRPDPWLAEGSGFPLNNTVGPGPIQAKYGVGKVSARTAVLDRNQADGWTSGSATAELEDGEYAWQDIEVPEGASRLDLMMTWDEPPADTLASAVLNDLDLWLDRDGDCGAAACGEHSSRSRIDNVEWIVIKDPKPGTWRAKVAAHRVYTAAPRAALAWTLIRGASTPTLSLETDRQRVSGVGDHELTLTLTADSYIAAGARLHIDCRKERSSDCADLVTVNSVALTRSDGVTVELTGEDRRPSSPGFYSSSKPVQLGAFIPIGELAAGERRQINVRFSLTGSADDDAALHFKADAWNGYADSVAVRIGSAGTPDIERPTNDDFAQATVIEGEEGSEALDLLHATPEPAEPASNPWYGRPLSSVWYQWTAPNSGPFRFAVSSPQGDGDGTEVLNGEARYDRIEVFDDGALAALRPVTGGLWSVTFFAKQGVTYPIRVAGSARGSRMELRWSPASRPANDNFADASVLEGESGRAEGTTEGATLEPGEFFGSHAATTWFRWTAPESGDWQFDNRSKRVLVFEGSELSELRLVSRLPETWTRFPAGAGREYRIAVADRDAYDSGGDYSLSWTKLSPRSGNDSFSNPSAIDPALSGVDVDVDWSATVEPDEPVETGVRTKWWSWESPASGRYTWRLGPGDWNYQNLHVSLFRGATLEDLKLDAEIGPDTAFKTTVNAIAGDTYRIAVGIRSGEVSGYDEYGITGTLAWGETPPNDDSDRAMAVAGRSGSVSASTAFATVGGGERRDLLGHSTLWWTYEAETSGWMRFAVDGDGPFRLAIHQASADGTDGLELVATSRWQRSEGNLVEVLFKAEEGVRYTVSLGLAGGAPSVGSGDPDGSDFTLRWEPAEAPAWLHYAGRLQNGGPDASGNSVEIRNPGALAMHPGGTNLYLASEIGLQVFARDAETGGLNLTQVLDVNPNLGQAVLEWDSNRDRLLVDDCGVWHTFVAVDDGAQLEDSGELAVANDPGTCADKIIIAPGGSDVYRFGGRHMERYTVEGGGNLRYAETTNLSNDFVAAVMSKEGTHLYLRIWDGLRVFKRDSNSGTLTSGSDLSISDWPSSDRQSRQTPLAIDDEDAHLFSTDYWGDRTIVFSLDDPGNPQHVASLRGFWTGGTAEDSCAFADARTGITAVDVFCPGVAYTAQWDAENSELKGTDYILSGVPDQAGRTMPHFDVPLALAATPDDRHLYLVTPKQGILIFSRDAPPAVEDVGEPELEVQRIWSTPAAPAAESTFRLTALVRNRGMARANDVTLRFRRSADARITARDAEVGSVELGALDASASRSRSVDVEAPETSGDYYYGACLEGGATGTETGEACSEALAVTVTEVEPGSDLVVQDFSVDPESPKHGASFKLSATVRNQGADAADATTLRYFRSDKSNVSRKDTEVGEQSVTGLDAGANRERSVTLTAELGKHWYGACVDRVDGERDTENNCSASVAVDVRDDHGDAFGDATRVSVPSTTAGVLEEGGDKDYFQVDVSAATTLVVETTGNTDTYGKLLDGNENSLEADDDSGFSANFSIVRRLGAGTYYIEVSGFSASTTGDYALRLSTQ